jgi:hypothetical protein
MPREPMADGRVRDAELTGGPADRQALLDERLEPLPLDPAARGMARRVRRGQAVLVDQ